MMKKNNPYVISHIVAVSENNVIGNGSELPWSLPDDFKYFKNQTWGTVVIMGRKTFESLKKELPGRINIVITKDVEWKKENILIANDLGSAMQLAINTDCKQIFIIGGGEIFKQTLNLTDKIYRTLVHAEVFGDIYYPEIDLKQWKLISSFDHPIDDKHKYPFTFEQWERITESNK